MTALLVALALNPLSLLVWLLIFCIVLWAARALMAAFGVGDPIATVIYVLLVVCFLIWLLGVVGAGPTVTIH